VHFLFAARFKKTGGYTLDGEVGLAISSFAFFFTVYFSFLVCPLFPLLFLWLSPAFDVIKPKFLIAKALGTFF